MAIPAAIYSLIMFVTSAIFGWLLGKQGNLSEEFRKRSSELKFRDIDEKAKEIDFK